MSARPYDWIETVDNAILDLEEKPQFDFFSFPKEAFSQRLGELFETDITININEKGWMPSDKKLEGINSPYFFATLNFSPLTSPFYFVISQQDVQSLMIEIFNEEEGQSSLIETDFAEGFFRYFALLTMEEITELKFASPLSLRLNEISHKATNSQSNFYQIDLSLAIKGKNFWGRLLIPEKFRKEWKNYFSSISPSQVSAEWRSKVSFDVSLEVGESTLSLTEWKSCEVGDFIVLDRCFVDPDTHQGKAILKLGDKPLFRGKLTPEGLKLLEYPFFEEVNDQMKRKFNDGEEDEDLYGDLDGEDEELEDEDDEDLDGEDEEFDEEFDEDEFEDEDEDEDEDEEEEEEAQDLAEEAVAEKQPKEKPSLPLKEIPIHLTVEVGRIRMNAEELMQLAPGNLLQLNVSPEQGVDLIINGKKIGRGELVKLGEMLGVRILQL